MHEIGLVDDIVSVIKAKLKDSKKNSSLDKITIAIGELEHVTPEHFEFHFRERTKGTILEKAKLVFKKVESRFKCKSCNREFSGRVGMEGCPDCKSKVNDILAGNGIYVESVELTTHG